MFELLFSCSFFELITDMTSPSNDKQPEASTKPDTAPEPAANLVNPWDGVDSPTYVTELTCSEGPSDDIVEFIVDKD